MNNIRNLIKALTGPLPIFWLFIILGMVLFLIGVVPIAYYVIMFAFIFLLLISTPFLPEYFLKKLEGKYNYLLHTDHLSENSSEVFIHILGAGYSNDSRLSNTANLHLSSTYRIVEGLRLFNCLENSKFILTGGGYKSAGAARLHADALRELGVPDYKIVTIDDGWNTYGEAIALSKQINVMANIIMVTDAVHMPRAIAIFKDLGLNPTPAPCNFRLRQNKHRRDFLDLLPSSHYINYSELVLNAFFGYIWMRLAKEK